MSILRTVLLKYGREIWRRVNAADIVLINPYPSYAAGINEATIEPPLGLTSIAAVLEREGFRAAIIDANVEGLPTAGVLRRLKGCKAPLYGISANIVTYRAAVKMAHGLREAFPRVTVLLGGPHPTSLPEKSLEDSGVDAVVMGEGELTVREIVRKGRESSRYDFHGVQGTVFRDRGRVFRNNPRPLIDDLDTLPFPAYHLLPDFKCYKSRARRRPVGSIITSRGCPYGCIYCNCNIFGKRLRMKSGRAVLEEIDLLHTRFGVRQIDILDDNFGLDRERVVTILEGLAARRHPLAINIQNGLRADQMDLDLVKLMKRAGVYKVSIGVESGSADMQRQLRKGLILDQVIDCTRWLKREGIITYGNFMFGLPGDTAESMRKTIDFAVRMNPHVANFMLTIPLPDTELYRMVKERGTFFFPVEEGLPFGFYGGKVCYIIDGMREEEVRLWYRKAYWEFYMRPSKILEILRTIRSLTEFRWTLLASWGILSNIVKGK